MEINPKYKPRHKIGDTVIAKGWIYYNLFEVLGGFYRDGEWFYTLSSRRNGWLSVKHCRSENEIRNTDLKWTN